VASYRRSDELTEYQAAREELEKLIGEVRGFEADVREHGDVERHISQRGSDVLRLLLQGYLDRLARQEERREDVVGPTGQAHRYARERVRKLMTLFGEVVVQRQGYSDHGTDSVFPLDEQLNMPTHLYSHGLRERLGKAVAEGSYEQAVLEIKAHTAGEIPKRQAEETARVLAQDFEGFYQARQSEDLPCQEEDFLVISADGKGVVMRHEDLREVTQRRAEEASHKLETRLSRGEKRNRKRMATVAAVYDVAAHYRTAEDIIRREPQDDHHPMSAPKPSNKRVWASLQQTPAQVLDEAFAEAKRRDPEDKRKRVVLVDGQEEQLRQVYAAAKRAGTRVTVIQDFFHVLEYLWKAVWCLFEEGSTAAEEWVHRHAINILRGKSSAVAAGMRRSATRRGLSASTRAPLDTCAQYLLKNRKRLRYDLALQKGMPIGTGVIEGACRHLVKRRMECSGARWSLDGAESVLRLRALRMSGDWEEYCAFHRHQERLRNHPAPSTQLPMAA
jgi:hypothetical protein